jgi:hypothetical protein
MILALLMIVTVVLLASAVVAGATCGVRSNRAEMRKFGMTREDYRAWVRAGRPEVTPAVFRAERARLVREFPARVKARP